MLRTPHRHPRIAVDPRVMSGKPCLRGTRVPVDLVLRYLAAGGAAEVKAAYPTLTELDFGHFGSGWRGSPGWRRYLLEADPLHQAPRHRRAVDRGREPAIVGHPVRRAAHPRQHLVEDLLERLAIDRHDDAARHGEGLGRAQAYGRRHARGRAPLHALIDQPSLVLP